MDDLIKRENAIEAVQRCCPDTSMYRAIRDVPSVEAVEISQEDFGTLCVCALRYCQGRKTYMPKTVQNIVRLHFKDLSDRDLQVIADDEKFQMMFNKWGDTVDFVDWEIFYKALKEFRSKDND